MIVRRYLAWIRTAPGAARASATAALAQAYLRSDLDPTERAEAEAALTLALDDADPAVRKALADAFSEEAGAPRHVVLALAGDVSEVAASVLARSPLLGDAELIEHAAVSDAVAQNAIASRTAISAPVAAALSEVADAPAIVTLVNNAGSEVPAFSLARIIERFGADPAVRGAVLARDGLPVDVRFAALLAERQAAMGEGAGGARRELMLREEEERVAITVAQVSADDEVDDLVTHLRATGRLTAGLLLRSVVSGDLRLATAAFANLADVAHRRAAALMAEPRAGGWRAMYRKAGLPEGLMNAFASAIAAGRDAASDFALFGPGPVVARRIIARVLADCGSSSEAAGERVLAVLRRFEVDIAREEARLAATALMDRIAIEHMAPLALAAPAISAEVENGPEQGAQAGAFDGVVLHVANDPLPPGVFEALEEALSLRGAIDEDKCERPAASEQAEEPRAMGEAAHVTAVEPSPMLQAVFAELGSLIVQPEKLAPVVAPAAQDAVVEALGQPGPGSAPSAAPSASEARALRRVEEMVAQAYAEARLREKAA